MIEIPVSARAILESSALANLATLESDGSPQVTLIWVGLDGGEIVAARTGSVAERDEVVGVHDLPA
jgi:hypothetical protein